MSPSSDPRPRIALVSHEVADIGGAERPVVELVRRAASEFDLVVVSRELAPELEPLVTWRRAWAPARPFRLKASVFFLTGGLRLLRLRRSLLHTTGPVVPQRADLLMIQFLREAFYDLAGASRRRLVTRVHLALERWCLRRARMLEAVSRRGAEELRRYYPRSRVTIAPNGIDPERFRPEPRVRKEVRAAEHVSADTVVALFVGGAWPRKGLSVALEGFSLAARASSADLRLWVVGPGDPDKYRGLLEREAILDRVRFFGSRPDAERFYQSADLFVLPTLYETFCLAAYEAAASGLPVIATPVGGIDELVGDGAAGIAVDRTAASVGAALIRLAGEPEHRARMGTTGRERARAYTWDRVTERRLEIYRHLLAGDEEAVEWRR
jgi:glycosyltransferase involved in cell wall biosynthesis